MKDYAPGTWGLSFIFSLEGSVFPKAMAAAMPNAILAVILWYLMRKVVAQEIFEDILSGVTVSQAWVAYNWVIGFMVSFRAQRAYSRWWEGGTLLQQARGEWFNAYSSLIAFCTREEKQLAAVRKFQQTVSRLTSMLYASALMSIATESDLDFEIIDATGLSEHHLQYLRTQPDKCEIIMQWIQRLIIDNMGNGVLPIPAPVISRVFQELSRGIVNIHNVRKITEFQFPFPAAQMIVTMLMIQWSLTPLVAAVLVGTPVWAFIVAFFPIFACWGINYIAGEIEQPFGTDYNDMPMHFMQASMNTSIMSLLDDCAQSPPDFDLAVQNTQDIITPGAKAPGENASIDVKMRSVRYVTIQDPEQLCRVKHRYTHGRRYSTTIVGPGHGLKKVHTKAMTKPKLSWGSEDMSSYSESSIVPTGRTSMPTEPDSSFLPTAVSALKTMSSQAPLQSTLQLPSKLPESAPSGQGGKESHQTPVQSLGPSDMSCKQTISEESQPARFLSSASIQDSQPVRILSTASVQDAPKATDGKSPSARHIPESALSPVPPDNSLSRQPPNDDPGIILLDA